MAYVAVDGASMRAFAPVAQGAQDGAALRAPHHRAGYLAFGLLVAAVGVYYLTFVHVA